MDSIDRRYKIFIDQLDYAIESVTLNPDQEEAIQGLMAWYQYWDTPAVEHEPAILAAFGGCGKSFLFSQLILRIVRDLFLTGKIQYTDEFRVALLAPSNRASEVMRQFSQEAELWRYCKPIVTTIHSFSGMSMDRLNSEAYYDENWRVGDDDKPYNLIVVDEYSMMDDEIFYKRLHNHHQAPILYAGNLEQLPAVKSEREPGTSIVDELYPRHYFMLHQVMRHSGGILAYTEQILQQYYIAELKTSRLVPELINRMGGLDERFEFTFNDPKKSLILPFDRTEDIFVGSRSEVLQDISERGLFSKEVEPYSIMTLCYTNKGVSDWNKIIRSFLYGAASSTYFRNEPFFVKHPIYTLQEGKMVKSFYTNQLIQLEQIERIDHKFVNVFDFPLSVEFPGVEIPFYRITSTTRYGQEKSFLKAATLKASAYIEEFFLLWFKQIKEIKDPQVRADQYNFWDGLIRYYGLKYNNDPKAKVPFSPLILPAYGATNHSAQGSTVQTAIVDLSDIWDSKTLSFDMKLRLTYVAVSRAKERLYLVTSDSMNL